VADIIVNRLVGKGRAAYGQSVGIMIMDEVFPRVPGDVGNATTFPFPIIYGVLRGFRGPHIVTRNVTPEMKSAVCDVAKELEERGVRAVVGGCGFMARFQKDLTGTVNVPVFSSSLLLVPMISRSLPRHKKRVGILFAQASEATNELLKAVGIGNSIPIAMAGFDSLKPSEMTAIQETDPEKRLKNLESALTKMARMLVSKNPDVGALVFECTNMPPAARAVQEATGLPVFDVTSLVSLVHDVVVRKNFVGYL